MAMITVVHAGDQGFSPEGIGAVACVNPRQDLASLSCDMTVRNVKRLLLDREWIDAGRNGFRLMAPADLLAERFRPRVFIN